ncbi:MAG: 2-amino-4-hydroxy-6-hydroxymethyldihydropteridine diphosphokinase [Thiogranum sp.]|nr:2-amino-4-hydroxy-6-hydroxymethyldihydropteridine diphosphokinase [Thiogranum sp.]
MPEVSAYIGLGSNLDNPQAQISRALEALAQLPGSRMDVCSSLYRSAPMGPQDQADYLNAAVRLMTTLAPEALLDALQAIEQAQGRVRVQHWGPRSLDLDILLYGAAVIDTERLQVPHPGIPERNFVLYPLAEIDSQLSIPGLGKLQVLLAQCPATGIERVHAAPSAVSP